jgi:hypothetical protein
MAAVKSAADRTAVPSASGAALWWQQVRATLARTPSRLLTPPGFDLPVMTRQEDVRHVVATPGRGLGVDGVLEQPVGVTGPVRLHVQ